MNDNFKKYIEQDIINPTFIFSGRDHLTKTLLPHKAYDSTGNIANEDTAIYLSSSFLIASAYAFKSNVASTDFTIGSISVLMKTNIADDTIGYVYVFKNDGTFICEHPGRSVQYKCYEEMKPLDILKIRYGDFKKFYNVISTKRTF